MEVKFSFFILLIKLHKNSQINLKLQQLNNSLNHKCHLFQVYPTKFHDLFLFFKFFITFVSFLTSIFPISKPVLQKFLMITILDTIVKD